MGCAAWMMIDARSIAINLSVSLYSVSVRATLSIKQEAALVKAEGGNAGWQCIHMSIKILYRLRRIRSYYAPDVYDYDDEGLAFVLLDRNTGTFSVPEELQEDVTEAFEECPTESIKLSDLVIAKDALSHI